MNFYYSREAKWEKILTKVYMYNTKFTGACLFNCMYIVKSTSSLVSVATFLTIQPPL